MRICYRCLRDHAMLTASLCDRHFYIVGPAKFGSPGIFVTRLFQTSHQEFVDFTSCLSRATEALLASGDNYHARPTPRIQITGTTEGAPIIPYCGTDNSSDNSSGTATPDGTCGPDRGGTNSTNPALGDCCSSKSFFFVTNYLCCHSVYSQYT